MEFALGPEEDGEGAEDLAALHDKRDRDRALQSVSPHQVVKGDGVVGLKVRRPDGPPLGHRDPRGPLVDGQLEARDEPVADDAGAAHGAHRPRGGVEPKEDGGIGAEHLDGLGGDRLDDLPRVEAPDQRLAGSVKSFEVTLPSARLAVQPHLLAQQSDEDETDAERT